MQKFVVLIVFLGLLALPLMAQKSGGVRRLSILAPGSDQQQQRHRSNSQSSFNGWDASVTGYFNKYFGVTGDFSGTYATIDMGSPTFTTLHLYRRSGGWFPQGSGKPIRPCAVRRGPCERLGICGRCVGLLPKTVSRRCSVAEWTSRSTGRSRFASLNLTGFTIISQTGQHSNNNVRITTGIVFRF